MSRLKPPAPMPPGAYPVLLAALDPAAVSLLLAWLASHAQCGFPTCDPAAQAVGCTRCGDRYQFGDPVKAVA